MVLSKNERLRRTSRQRIQENGHNCAQLTPGCTPKEWKQRTEWNNKSIRDPKIEFNRERSAEEKWNREMLGRKSSPSQTEASVESLASRLDCVENRNRDSETRWQKWTTQNRAVTNLENTWMESSGTPCKDLTLRLWAWKKKKNAITKAWETFSIKS